MLSLAMLIYKITPLPLPNTAKAPPKHSKAYKNHWKAPSNPSKVPSSLRNASSSVSKTPSRHLYVPSGEFYTHSRALKVPSKYWETHPKAWENLPSRKDTLRQGLVGYILARVRGSIPICMVLFVQHFQWVWGMIVNYFNVDRKTLSIFSNHACMGGWSW